jgi:type I restriction-modification system DNA methylase subunit
MWISYSDSEVNKYHPICEKAINYALRLAGKDSQYRVIHHQYTGSLEMDFVIQNMSTGKYLCVIEVKRTPADVHSARYQFQAMSYVQMNSGISEKSFYILTNLEYAFAFRYDASRPRVFQQMLKPGLASIGSFERDDEKVFFNKLVEYFKDRIEEYCANSYDYLVTLEEFALHMEHIKGDSKKWKSHLAVLLYEYIRGAFTYLNRNDLPDIRIFHNDIARICNEAARVNFKDIFNYSDETFERNVNINNSTFVNLYDFGNQNVTGDSVSGILHQIVSEGHEHEGEVPTDLELGRLVAELAKYVNGDLADGGLLCDPAAGSGNLISSSMETFGLNPKQILVNDNNSKLLELLSLRLGLNYAKTISNGNSPAIFNVNVTKLDRDFFANVKVIVMNPPFVAGINCVERKQEFYRKIRRLAGRDTGTNIGQMPLEAAFLELITLMAVPGTTIACVFPKTHLMARGVEAKIIRRLILNNLGLRVVFSYPGDEIFDEVTKDTCVLVGKAMQPAEFIDVVSSYEKIPDLDIHRFAQTIRTELNEVFHPMMPGVVAKKISARELYSEIENGWRSLNSEMVEAIAFVKKVFESSPQFGKLSSFCYDMKRGQAGNSGGSDIMFFDSREDLFIQFQNRGIRLSAGMRNAKLDYFNINGGDSQFLDVSINDERIIEQIVDAYNALPERSGKQKRQKKDKQAWIKILQRESRGGFGRNSVLIPRAIRKTGRIYLSDEPVFVSTNFVVCTLPTYEKALLLSTWMSTVFYQLICEVSSKDQEGMRKMEVNDISTTLIPDLDNVAYETIDKLQAEKDSMTFLNLNNAEIRNVDRIWAEELFASEAEEILQQAIRLLGFLANRRNP